MNKRIVLYIILVFVVGANCYAQSDSLTLRQSIEIALRNNPAIKAVEGRYEASEAFSDITTSSLYPQVALQGTWLSNGGTSFIGPTARQGNYDNYQAGFQGQMLLYDFGRTYNRISSSDYLAKASESDLNTARQDIILATEVAYFSHLQAVRNVELARDVVSQAEEHLTRAKGYFNVGKSPQYDVLKAESDLANARLYLIEAESNVSISRVRFGNVLGTNVDENLKLQDILEVRIDTAITLEQASALARNQRPELISQSYEVESARSLVRSARDAHFPALFANGGYNYRSFSLNEPFRNSWNYGLSISVPIFQGFAVQAGTEQAEANLKTAEAVYQTVLQTVNLELNQELLTFRQARERVSATDLLVRQAEELLRIAEGRYNQGVGSPVEVTDARVTYFNSVTFRIQALYDYQVSYARLQRAMGNLK